MDRRQIFRKDESLKTGRQTGQAAPQEQACAMNTKVHQSEAKQWDDGMIPSTDLAIPPFAYKSDISLDRKFWLIRKWKETDGAASDSARVKGGLLDRSRTVGLACATMRIGLANIIYNICAASCFWRGSALPYNKAKRKIPVAQNAA